MRRRGRSKISKRANKKIWNKGRKIHSANFRRSRGGYRA